MQQGDAHHNIQTGYPVPAAAAGPPGAGGGGGGGYYPSPPPTQQPQYATPPPVYAVNQNQQQQPPPRTQGTSLLSAAANIGATLGAAALAAASDAAGGRRTATAAPAVVQMHAAQVRAGTTMNMNQQQQQQQQQGASPFPFQQQFQPVFASSQASVPTTCWCGCHDDPECNPCLRAVGKTLLFPAAVAAWPLGAALWAALQIHYCVFSCCMMGHVTRMQRALAAGAGADAAQPRRDVIDCWECQAKAWVACDDFNGRCWVCELPATKRVLKGHVVEAPCQLCLWGTTR